MVKIPAAALAAIFPVDASRFPLVDGNGPDTKNGGNVLDGEIIRVEGSFQFKREGEEIDVGF